MPKKKQAKARLPKKIAGVRLTKELRASVAPVLRFADHPLVNEVLTAALLSGAGALVGKKGPSVSTAIKDAAMSSLKKRGRIELALAVAAGEIASQIVAAYEARSRTQAKPRSSAKKPTPKKRSSAAVRRK